MEVVLFISPQTFQFTETRILSSNIGEFTRPYVTFFALLSFSITYAKLACDFNRKKYLCVLPPLQINVLIGCFKASIQSDAFTNKSFLEGPYETIL